MLVFLPTISLAKTWVVSRAAMTLRSKTKRTPSGSRSKKVFRPSRSGLYCSSSVVPRGLLPPAPLSSRVQGPKAESTSSRAAPRLCLSRQLAFTAMALPPAAAISSATALAASRFRSNTATFAPRAAKALENMEQSTPPPPVTTAT